MRKGVSVQINGQKSLQQRKHNHNNNDFQPIFFCRQFEMRFSVTKFAYIVMYEVLKQIDENVDKKRNENQTRAFIR